MDNSKSYLMKLFQMFYEELCKMAGIAQEEGIDENLDENLGKKKFGFGTIFEVISGVFAPVVTAFAGAGILKG